MHPYAIATLAAAGPERPPFSPRWYVAALVISFAASIVLFLSSYEELIGAMHNGNVWGDLQNVMAHVGSGAACFTADINDLFSGDAGCIPATDTSKTGAPSPHATTLFSGILQISGVITISILWFYTFMLYAARSATRKRYAVGSSIATVCYVLGMFNAYQPAVFVAALVAIFVAAEHYGKLHQHEKHLANQARHLVDQENHLANQEKHLASQGEQLSSSKGVLDQTSGKLNSVVDDVMRISTSMQLTLNDAGVEIFQREVYAGYSRAKTIYAVIRNHKIEDGWWARAEKGFADTKSLAEVWNWYELPLPVEPTKDQKLTMYAALTQQSSRDAPTERPSGVTSAYFVSNMPMHGSKEWEQRDKGVLFEDLLGLAWECLVLEKVRQKLEKSDSKKKSELNESIGGWIATPFCWAHATDKEVWQVIRRTEVETSTVMKTADLALNKLLDQDLSRKIIESMHTEIRRYLQRGIRAEEYLCGVLCYAAAPNQNAPLHTLDRELAYSNIGSCLRMLGIDAWLNYKKNKGTNPAHATPEGRQIMTDICVAIFSDFIHMCWQKPVADGAGPKDRLHTSLLLAQEVL
jgi:hypothetical protein